MKLDHIKTVILSSILSFFYTVESMLQLRLSRYDFMESEYGRAVTFRIYDESDTPLNCTSYTSVECIVTDSEGNTILNQIIPAWTTQASGVGTITFLDTKKLTEYGTYFIQVILEKSGEESPTEAVKISVLESGVKA